MEPSCRHRENSSIKIKPGARRSKQYKMEKAWPRHSALNLLYHKIIFNNSLYDLSFSVLLCYKVPLSFEALRYSCTSYSSSETE